MYLMCTKKDGFTPRWISDIKNFKKQIFGGMIGEVRAKMGFTQFGFLGYIFPSVQGKTPGITGGIRAKQGFTLIELLVVIAIIGLLSSVVLASLSTARTKARDAKRTADIKSVQLALEMYYDSNGAYPRSPEAIMDTALKTVLVPDYIKAIPKDPVAGRLYYYYTNNATSSQYYAIRVPYENIPACFVCRGNSSCVPTANFWSLPMCN